METLLRDFATAGAIVRFAERASGAAAAAGSSSAIPKLLQPAGSRPPSSPSRAANRTAMPSSPSRRAAKRAHPPKQRQASAHRPRATTTAALPPPPPTGPASPHRPRNGRLETLDPKPKHPPAPSVGVREAARGTPTQAAAAQTGRQTGSSDSDSNPCAVSTRIPPARSRAEESSALLPVPGSPSTTNDPDRPTLAASSTRSIRPRSPSRPTSTNRS